MKLISHLSRSRSLFLLAAASCVPLMGVSAVSATPIIIQTVPVGNVGNAADPATGFGSVNYAYNIGEYDVTSAQYAAFLNAVAQADPLGLYNATMSNATAGNPGIIQSGPAGSYTYSVAAGRANRPMTDVSFWNATRFANWLDNGQPTGAEGPGTTETGTYTLTPTGIADNTITRNAGASWAITSENEWYKAAYYSPTLNANAGGYWLFPTQSNSISPTEANYGSNTDTTDVGSYPYPSYYDTYDQGGDVFQWTESIVNGPPDDQRNLRGGPFDGSVNDLRSGSNVAGGAADGFIEVGFRVSEVPEPASLAVLTLGVTGMLARRRGVRR